MKHAECKIKKRAHFEHKIIAYKKASVLKLNKSIKKGQ